MLEAERGRRRALEERIDDLEAAVEDLVSTNEHLVTAQDAMHAKLESLAGIAEGEKSTAKKRRVDLFIVLQRKADVNDGEFALDYNGVKEELAALGHKDVKDQEAYRDMRWLAERVRGCYSSQHPVSGNEAVCIDLDAVSGASLEEAAGSNDVSSQETGGARSEQNLADDLPMIET